MKLIETNSGAMVVKKHVGTSCQVKVLLIMDVAFCFYWQPTECVWLT